LKKISEKIDFFDICLAAGFLGFSTGIGLYDYKLMLIISGGILFLTGFVGSLPQKKR